MKQILIILLFTLSLLVFAEEIPHKDCAKVTNYFKLMSKATVINHKNMMMLKSILDDPSKSKKEKAQARKALEDMNKKTTDRSTNSGYKEVYKEMKSAYVANCNMFTKENNETISGLIKRSIDFNNVMAKVLGDELAYSKVK